MKTATSRASRKPTAQSGCAHDARPACSNSATPNLGVGVLLLLSVLLPEMTPGTFFNGAYNALFEGQSERCHAYGPLGSSRAERGYAFWKLTAGASASNTFCTEEEDDEDDDETTAALRERCSAAKLMIVPASPASGHLQSQGQSTDDDGSSDAASTASRTELMLECASAHGATEFIGPQFLLPTVHSQGLVQYSASSEQTSASHSFAELPASTSAFDRLLAWRDVDGEQNALSLVISYLPLQEALECALVSKEFRQAVRKALPVTKDGFLCLPYIPRALRASGVATTAAGRTCQLLMSASTNASASPTKIRQCHDCRNPVAAPDAATGTADPSLRCSECIERNPSGEIVRVFMGQLRKDRTSEFPAYLLSMIFPDMYIPHIESHTGVDNRGKGCAWVHVTSDADAQRLLALDKRMFLDLDDYGQEAILLCRPTEAGRTALRAYADRFGPDPLRPTQLPRQPIVLELPKNGAPVTKTRRRQQRVTEQSSPARTPTSDEVKPLGKLSNKRPEKPQCGPATKQHFQQPDHTMNMSGSPSCFAKMSNPYTVDLLQQHRMYTSVVAESPYVVGVFPLPNVTVGYAAM